jgi:hypothetical protein
LAAETYSLAVTGLRADSPWTAKPITLGDSAAQGISASGNTAGGLQYAARTGVQVLCKRNDGSQAWYTIDAERSTPAAPVLKAV